MSPFEFFFSFYGLLLALSVAVVAAGAVKALKLRTRRELGLMTPLLAVFILLDIATFWQWAWDGMRELPFTYGLMVVGMIIALIYFAAASFVFPEDDEKRWKTLDEHYDARKRPVIVLVIVSNTIMLASTFLLNGTHPMAGPVEMTSTFFWALYALTLGTCFLVRSRTVNAVMLGINIAIYLLIAVGSLLVPQPDAVKLGERPALSADSARKAP